MRFASLGSGSKGNATLVQFQDTLLMIDCGFSVRETARRLARLDLSPADLSAILVTHEHSDHSSGVARLSRKYDIPVYLTHGTALTGRCDGAFDLNCFNCEDSFTIGSLAICAVAVPHDAAEPCQYRIDSGERSLGVLTDLGHVTRHVIDSYAGCHSLVVEFNHDEQMLQNGRYPPQLKRRVGGDWGHLNNRQAALLLRELDSALLNNLVVAHISENNNARELAEAALVEATGSAEGVVWACQNEGFGWLQV